MAIYNPAHPGEILGEDLLKPLGLSVTQAAEHLRVSRKTLSKIINGGGGDYRRNGIAFGKGVWQTLCRPLAADTKCP